MAQTINIVELDIDTEALTQKVAQTQEVLIGTGAEIASLKNQFKKGEIGVKEYTTQMATLTAQQKNTQGELRIYDTLLRANMATKDKELQSNKILTGSIKEISAALSQNKEMYSRLTPEERENQAIGGELLKTIQAQDKSYKELQKSIGNTQVEVGNYKEEVKKALQEHFGFESQIDQLTDKLGVFKSSGVAVIESLKNFVSGNKDAANAVRDHENGTKKLTIANLLWAKATGGTSTALKILRGALIATGLGAFVVVLGSLIAYLTSTQEGINMVNRVLTPLKIVFQTLWGVVQNVGKSLVEAFSSPQKALNTLLDFLENQTLGRLRGILEVAKGIAAVFSGDVKEGFKQMTNGAVQAAIGIEKVTDKAKAMGQTISQAIQRGEQINEINEKLSKGEADFIEKTAQLKQEFKEQNKIAEDTTKTLAEREAAARKSIEIQQQINQLAKERNLLEQQRLELQFASNDTSDADRAELARKKAELSEANAAMEEAVTTQNNKLNSLRKEANEKAKQLLKERLAQEKKAIEHYVAMNSPIAQSLQERLAIEEKAMQERLTILEKERKLGEISKDHYQREKQKIELDFLKTRAQLSIEATKKELEQYQEANQTKITEETKLTQALVDEELLRVKTIYDKKVQALEEEKALKTQAREWDYNQEAQHQETLSALKKKFQEEYQTQEKELTTQLQAQALQEKKTNQEIEFQDRLLKLQEESAMQWEKEAELLRQKQAQEQQALLEQYQKAELSHDQYLQKLSILNRQHAQQDKELKQKTEEAKMQLTTGALGQAKALFEEHTAVGKAAAIAQATINTYLGVTKAISAYPPPMNAVMAGVTMAMGLKNIQKIMTTQSKFAQGGLIVGKSHTEGGVPFSVGGLGGFEAEGGEYIINKNATKRFFPLIEWINHYGKTGRRSLTHFVDGGLVSKPSVPTLDIDALTQAVREGSRQGALEGAKIGTEQGAILGTKQGAFEGAMQGSYQGATLGTSTAIYESSLRVQDQKTTQKMAVV